MNVQLNNCTAANGSSSAVASTRRAALFTMLFCMAVYSQVAWTDLPSYYGERFSQTGKTWMDAGPSLEGLSTIGVESKSEKSYRRQLDEIESTGGPYADRLAEPLLGLGRGYASTGEYDRALHLFQRALHIVRLNDGLYSEQQAPFVRELLNTIRLTGDLHALDDRYEYFFRLYGSGQPPYTPLRMRATFEYLRWQREALRLEIDSEQKQRLLALYQLNERLLTATRESGSSSLEDQWRLTISQIRNLYLLQSIIHPRITVSGVGTGSLVRSIASAEGEGIDFDQRRMETIQQSALRRGRLVLEDYISTLDTGHASVSLEHRARAVLELGDWHQWNGDKRRANDYYEKVVNMLGEEDEGELMRAWFGEPVELPDNGAFWQPPASTLGNVRTVLAATYDVSASGRVRNISLEDVPPEEQSRFYRFKRELKNTRFRPRYIAGGEAVNTEQLKREYELHD